MNKKLLYMFLGIPLFNVTAVNADDSIVTPNTRKTIAETTDKKKVKWSPKVNMTEILPSERSETADQEQEIYFAADEVENNQEQSLITAIGNVEIIRGNLTLYADKVVYNQKEDTVNAVGNVVLKEKDGSVVFADYSELNNHMTQGEMQNIKVIMVDKSRMAAQSFNRKEKDKKVLRNAVYSPCDTCRNSNPLWQIKATKVVHDAESKDVNYQNAFLEVKGTPVFYTPFLSHPDPTVKRRSGFLFPRILSNSYLGGAVQAQYFWSIDEQQDILFNPIFTTDKGVVYSAAANKYFYNGDMSVSGSFLEDKERERNRGNLFAAGRYEVNDYWVADTDINYVSDNTYLKDLKLPNDDDTWLTSRARLQGFDNRNYAALEAYYYKILSYDLRYANRPMVMPLFNYENISNPDKYGAYSKTNLNFASVTHEEDNASQRVSMINSWNLPYTSPYGEKYKLVASLKSDFYYVDNYVYETEEYTGTAARIFPQVGLEWRLPFIRATEDSRHIIEPIVVAAIAPNQSNEPEKIPNEDSQDIELNDTNILNLDRYSGYDRNDVGSRVSYGVNWSSYGNFFGRTSFLLAQSYEFNKDESFASDDQQTGSFTDYVGRLYASPNEYFDLNYRFKLNKDDYSVTYSELSSGLGPRIFRLYLSYIYFADNKEESSIQEGEREELYSGIFSTLTKNWSLNIYNRQDLAPGGGVLEYGGALIYEDECTRFAFNISKDNSNDPNYEGDFEFGFTFFLKTLGGTGKGI